MSLAAAVSSKLDILMLTEATEVAPNASSSSVDVIALVYHQPPSAIFPLNSVPSS